MIGEVVGAVGEHAGVGRGELPGGHGLAGLGQGAAVQRPGGPHQAGGGGRAHAEAVAEPPSGGAGLHALLSPGSPAGIHRGQLAQPLAFQAVHQPPQGHDPLGHGAISQLVRVLVGEVLELGHQRRKPRRCAGRVAGRMCVRVHGRNLSTSQLEASTNPKIGDNFPPELGRPSVPAGSRPTLVPGECMGPDTRDHRATPTAPGPMAPDPPVLPSGRPRRRAGRDRGRPRRPRRRCRPPGPPGGCSRAGPRPWCRRRRCGGRRRAGDRPARS
jgi:hypothetical protein